jgi:uncharacterized membrane protein
MNRWLRTHLATFLQTLLQTTAMNVKRMFGVLLTILGIGGLIYAAVLFMNRGGGDLKALAVYGILGAVFFFTGIGLIKTTQDDARPPVS